MNTRLLNVRTLIRFFTKGDAKTLANEYNDLFCLFLSQIVYFSDNFIVKQLKDIGCESFTLVKYNGPTAICLYFNGVNYVATKGLSSRNKKEWFTILNFIPKKYSGISAHGGFVLVAKRLAPIAHDFINIRRDAPVIITGHSMGGAVSILASLEIPNSKVVTFGAPKTIEADPTGEYAPRTLTHYTINTDPVTHLPPFIYVRPGKGIIEKKAFNWLKWFANHSLYVYSKFITPILAGGHHLSSTP